MQKLIGTVAALALSITPLVATPTSSAKPTPDDTTTYILPGYQCVFPEGVEVWGDTYYVGSTCNGKLYRGDLSQRVAEVFLPADPEPLLYGGIEATATRLVAARGDGMVTVHDRSTGKVVARFSTGLGYDSTPNDVAITPNGDAYVTDFTLSKLYRIPAERLVGGDTAPQPLPIFLDFTETNFPAEDGSANGIVATPDGRYLIVAHYSRGELYRVRLADQDVTRIDVPVLTPDGLTLHGADVLYAVEPDNHAVAKIRLSDDYLSGVLVSRTTNPEFRCPTTADVAGDRLLVANSQFCVAKLQLPFKLTSIPLP